MKAKIMRFIFCLLWVMPSFLFSLCDNIEIFLNGGYAISEMKWREHGELLRTESFQKVKWIDIQSPVVGGAIKLSPFQNSTSANWLKGFSIQGEGNFYINQFSDSFIANYTEIDLQQFFHCRSNRKSHFYGSDVLISLGYDYLLGNCAKLTVLVGYQNENLNFKQPLKHMTSDAEAAKEIESFHFKPLRYELYWNSVWLGLNGAYCFNRNWK